MNLRKRGNQYRFTKNINIPPLGIRQILAGSRCIDKRDTRHPFPRTEKDIHQGTSADRSDNVTVGRSLWKVLQCNGAVFATVCLLSGRVTSIARTGSVTLVITGERRIVGLNVGSSQTINKRYSPVSLPPSIPSSCLVVRGFRRSTRNITFS